MRPKEKLVPGGILEPVSGRSFLFFGSSYKTSDFLVDGLLLWWEERKQELSHLKQLVINMDNGPECNGHRSQFLCRMAEFADTTGLVIRLIYYPPYHSKYNSIERYWAGLEKSWNGYLLDSRDNGIESCRQLCLERNVDDRKVVGNRVRKGCKTQRQGERCFGRKTDTFPRASMVGYNYLP
jgi:hypothetical protein